MDPTPVLFFTTNAATTAAISRMQRWHQQIPVQTSTSNHQQTTAGSPDPRLYAVLFYNSHPNVNLTPARSQLPLRGGACQQY